MIHVHFGTYTIQKLYFMKIHKLIYPAAIVFTFAACKKENTITPIGTVDCNMVTYSQTIKPLFETHCVSCHATGSGDGALSNHAEVKVYVDNGKLKDEVLTSQGMPVGSSFTSEELGQIQCWIDAGGPNN